jgi:hypothetical protein
MLCAAKFWMPHVPGAVAIVSTELVIAPLSCAMRIRKTHPRDITPFLEQVQQ